MPPPSIVLAAVLVLLRATPLIGAPPTAAKNEAVRLDCFGDPLPPGAVARLGTIRLRYRCEHRAPCVTFSPDGKLLATAGGTVIRFWEAATGKEVRRFSVPNSLDTAHHLVFSSDGRKIAVLGAGGTDFAIWQVDKTSPLFAASAPGLGHLLGATFSLDGKTLYTADAQALYGWVATTGRQTFRFQHSRESDEIDEVVFSQDGKRFLTANGSKPPVRVWDTRTGRLLRVLRKPGKSGLLCATFNHDGSLLATGSKDGTIRIWDLNNGKEIHKLEQGENKLVAIAFRPDGKGLATARWARQGSRESSQTGSLNLWDLDAGRARLRKSLKAPGVEALVYSPDGKTLAWICCGESLRLLDAATGAERLPFASHGGPVNAVVYSPDGRCIVTGSSDGTIRFWEAATGMPKGVLRWHTDRVYALAFSPDGKWLASGSGDHKVALWNVATQKRQCQYKDVTVFAFSPDSKTLACGGLTDGEIHFWDVARGAALEGIQEDVRSIYQFHYLVFSPDGKMLAVGRKDSFRLYDVGSHRLLRMVDPDKEISSLVFSPDGRTLVYGSEKRISLWELAACKERFRLRGQGFRLRVLAFSPDGRLLTSSVADTEGTMTVRELLTGKERSFAAHQQEVFSVAFAPDGKHLATASEDTTALVWNLEAISRLHPHSFIEQWKPRNVLGPKDLELAWTDLAGVDAVKAQQAIWALVNVPRLTIPFLRQRLHPAVAPSPGRVTALIADLDSDSFKVREKANAELARLGALVEPPLRTKLAGRPTLETRRRITHLLAKLSPPKASSAEELRIVRAVEALEQMGTPEAIQLLRTLAKGADGARRTQEAKRSLERLRRRAKP